MESLDVYLNAQGQAGGASRGAALSAQMAIHGVSGDRSRHRQSSWPAVRGGGVAMSVG